MQVRKVIWTGNDLNKLLTLSNEELKKEYWWMSWEVLRRTRNKYREKARKVAQMEHEPNNPEISKLSELFKRSGIDVDSIAKINRVNVYQGYMKNDEGEFETVDLVSAQFVPKQDLEEFEPIAPAKITPTKKKPIKRESKLILASGDGQVDFRRIIDPVTDEQKLVPLHHEAAHRIIQQLNAQYRPDTTVNLGDFADMSSLSRFDPDSDHFHKTLGPSMRYIHDVYPQLVSDNPDAHHVEVDSNHAVRIKNQVLRNIPAIHDFVRPGEEYPMITYYYLANLGKLGIDFISGYGNAEFVYGEEYGPAVVFKHGSHSSSTPGATVRKEAAENPEVSIIRGHGHADEHISIANREGRRLFYHQLGSTCLNTGPVPGYHSSIDDHNQPVEYHNRRHTNTVAMIEDYGNGEYQVDIINIFKGMAYYRGQVYQGKEDDEQIRKTTK